MNRRELLIFAATAPLGMAAATRSLARSRKLKILVLGGTNFVGPAIVEQALSHGHEVTLFNRGVTNPGLFPALELIKGNRLPNTDAGLAALQGKRRWDAVIDVWPDNTAIVEPTARLLMDRTDYYYFVSSIAVYKDFSKTQIEQTAPLRDTGTGYGGGKAASENLLVSIFPGRAGFARPCAIAGTRDSSLSNHFWLSRLAKPEPHIAPGDGLDLVQMIDVRDVATWIIDCVGRRRASGYNVCAKTMTWQSYLTQSRAAVDGRGELVWMDADFLKSHGIDVENSNDLPVWTPRGGINPGLRDISAARAEKEGLTTRAFRSTAADSWESYRKLFPHGVTYPYAQYGHTWGISEEKERSILSAWATRGA